MSAASFYLLNWSIGKGGQTHGKKEHKRVEGKSDQFGREAVEAVIRAEYNRCRSQNELAEAGVYFGKISTRRKNEE